MSTPSMMSDLENAVASHSAERRNETLRQVTDLFVGGAPQYSEEQVALFDGVIGRLAQDADVAARTELSARLAAIDNAPVGTIERLANDDAIAVAGPVLKGSVRLTTRSSRRWPRPGARATCRRSRATAISRRMSPTPC